LGVTLNDFLYWFFVGRACINNDVKSGFFCNTLFLAQHNIRQTEIDDASVTVDEWVQQMLQSMGISKLQRARHGFALY